MDHRKPGSKEAMDTGCMCPIFDNHYGQGYRGDGAKYGWVVNGECELHNVPALDALLKAVRGKR